MVNAISLIGGLSQPPLPIEPFTPVNLTVPGPAAVFFKLNVLGRATPLKIYLARRAHHHEEDFSGQHDFEVYWSYVNKYPFQSDAEDSGKFPRGQRLMALQPYGLHQF